MTKKILEKKIPKADSPKTTIPKKKITKYRVDIGHQWKNFNTQNEAREFTKQILMAPIYFITLEKVEVEEENHNE